MKAASAAVANLSPERQPDLVVEELTELL